MEMPLRKIKIHETFDNDTGKTIKKYYTYIPIPEEVPFVVEYEGNIITMRISSYNIVDPMCAHVELVSVKEK